MNESRLSFVELVVGEVPEKGSVHSLGSLIIGGVGGGYLGHEASKPFQEDQATVAITEIPVAHIELPPEAIGAVGGAVLGAALMYAGIRKWAIGQVGLTTYKQYKKG